MTDSAEVLALKANRTRCLEDRSDWGNDMARHYSRRIRAQRLAEARAKGTHTKEEWEAIVEKFGGRCVRCGCYPVGGPCKDHIHAIYQGGSDAADNLQPLCRECNTGKGTDRFNWASYREQNGFADAEFQDEPNA